MLFFLIYHYCSLLLLVNNHYVWLVSYLSVWNDLTFVFLNNLSMYVPLGPGDI